MSLTKSQLDVLDAYTDKYVYKRKETVEADTSGNVVIKKTMDAEPIIEAVKMSGELRAPVRNSKGMLHLGSIDPLTAANWAKECGASIGSKEFVAYAKKKLLSGEFSKFRVQRQKRYF